MSVGYGSGRGTRLATGLRVLLGGILALAVVLLVNYLAARPGMRVRIDMTAKDVNTLDPATVRTLENLQGPITADVFFEPVRQPLTELVGQVQARTVALLDRMALAAPDRFRVRHNDLHDKMATQARMEQLRLRGLDNVVVLSQDGEAPGEVLGKPKAVRLLGGLATIDLGNPNPDQYRPPLLQSFDAEANLLAAIKSVSVNDQPNLIFVQGHGESDPFAEGAESLTVLRTTMQKDGFHVATWNPQEEPELPADTTVLAMIAPRDRVADSTWARIDRFLEEGGRVLVAADVQGEVLAGTGMIEWAKRHGLEVTQGVVMQPFPDPTGSGAMLVGMPECGLLLIGAQQMNRHAITQPFIEAGRSFVVTYNHGVRVVSQPELGAGVASPLFRSRKNQSWLDTLPLDFRQDAAIEPIRGTTSRRLWRS
ncbi:MAG: GldG family protein [Planctomycetota bacterium]